MDDTKNKMPKGFNFRIGKTDKPQMTWSLTGLYLTKRRWNY